jgi:hypothetical protein
MSLIKRTHAHLSLAPMCRPALFLLAALSGGVLSPQASASDITVGSPVNGTKISSPALIRAHNVGCDGVPPTSFGYSIDNSTGIVMGATAYDIDVTAQAIPSGTHTVHFKSWTSRGECPTVNTTFTVGASTDPAPSPSPSIGIPSYAVSSGDLDASGSWAEGHDGGTPGESRGSMVYPASTPLYDDARKFYMTYSDRAGERWSLSFARDAKATYFVLDTYVLFPNPSEVLNLEMDMNQVMPNGETVILGTQCSGVTGSWETAYTSGKYDHWLSTNIKCNPKDWSANQWHHVQIGLHHDENGVVTHDWVNLDGAHHVFEGTTRLSAHSLGWGAGDIDVQYQIEGANSGSGSVTSYIHKMTVYRWQ